MAPATHQPAIHSPADRVSVHFCEDRRRFVEFPRALYANDPLWVPPLSRNERRGLDKKRQPFFAHAQSELFVAERDGVVVGRISAARDHVHDAFRHDRVGFFGHFEASDEEAAHALLQAASDWLSEHGATELRGPVDLSTNYRCGVLVDGEPGVPSLRIPHNPPTYPTWFESFGLGKAIDAWTITVDEDAFAEARAQRVATRAARGEGVAVRGLRRGDWMAEIETIWSLYHRFQENNWGFVPMTKPEFDYEARSLRKIVVPELVRILELHGTPIGFLLSLPDLAAGLRACRGRLFPFGWWRLLRAMAASDRCRVVAFGVLEEHRKHGFETLLLQDFAAVARRHGIRHVECGPIFEDNEAMLQPLLRLGGRRTRRYRVYQAPLPLRRP
jgi:GNAT superfamily N-acetyltransferase